MVHPEKKGYQSSMKTKDLRVLDSLKIGSIESHIFQHLSSVLLIT